jgi:transcription initiation factor IIF auxiliary subunit
VSETGWGEFEAGLRIFFKDPTESPIDLFHNIKLYPQGVPQGVVIRKVTISLLSMFFGDALRYFGPSSRW